MKRYLKTDKVKDLSSKEFIKLIKFLCSYCADNMGYNNRKKNVLSIDYYHGESENYGYYDPRLNSIHLSLENCKTVGKLVETFVHEYTHSLQPCVTKYEKLLKEHGYRKHPFEIEAYESEKIHTNKALREFRKTL